MSPLTSSDVPVSRPRNHEASPLMVPLLLDTSRTLPEDCYLTDGRRLCVLGQLAEGSFYELEDCKTLDVVLIAAKDLLRLRLRHVVAGRR